MPDDNILFLVYPNSWNFTTSIRTDDVNYWNYDHAVVVDFDALKYVFLGQEILKHLLTTNFTNYSNQILVHSFNSCN